MLAELIYVVHFRVRERGNFRRNNQTSRAGSRLVVWEGASRGSGRVVAVGSSGRSRVSVCARAGKPQRAASMTAGLEIGSSCPRVRRTTHRRTMPGVVEAQQRDEAQQSAPERDHSQKPA